MGTEEANDTKCEEAVSDLENKIIRQVEYYFGDYNLQKDKFLREKVKENDGWIPMDTMVKFHRLKQLSEDFDVITTALKKSPNQLMEVNEDGTMIRRSLSKPLPDPSAQTREDRDRRTVYVKGFKADTTLDELLDYFKPFKNPENVFMRRRQNKKFKGSVFVTFQSEADAEEFLKMKDIKWCGTDLLRESKLDYVKRKLAQFEERKKAKDDKKKGGENNSAKETSGVKEESVVRGCLLKMVGFSEDTLREHIKEILGNFADITYIDYSKGKTEAVVRFEQPVAAEVLQKATIEKDDARKIVVNGAEITVTFVEGDEEVEYWKSMEIQRINMKNQKREMRKRAWGGRNGRQRRGRGGGRDKRRRQDEDDDQSKDDGDSDKDDNEEPKAKYAKVEKDEAADSKGDQQPVDVPT